MKSENEGKIIKLIVVRNIKLIGIALAGVFITMELMHVMIKDDFVFQRFMLPLIAVLTGITIGGYPEQRTFAGLRCERSLYQRIVHYKLVANTAVLTLFMFVCIMVTRWFGDQIALLKLIDINEMTKNMSMGEFLLAQALLIGSIYAILEFDFVTKSSIVTSFFMDQKGKEEVKKRYYLFGALLYFAIIIGAALYLEMIVEVRELWIRLAIYGMMGLIITLFIIGGKYKRKKKEFIMV